MSSDAKKSILPIVVDLSKHHKSNAKPEIIETLNRIKEDPKCWSQFTKLNGLTILIDLLRLQNVKILNLSLSILANICMTHEAREKVRGTKVAPYVIWILKNLKLGSTLQCRACRLIGNLSDCSWHAKALCDAGAIQALADLLKLKTNTQTSLMAIRAIRNIWSMYKDSREEILDSGAMRNMTAILVSRTKQPDKQSDELIEACLKAMCVFTTTHDSRCADQMRGESKAEGYRSIVASCTNGGKSKMAIRCLYNLCQIAECRPILGTAGAIERLVMLIKCDVVARLSWEVLASLCLFCREAVNRAKIRDSTGLEAMLRILKSPDMDKYHPLLLHALSQFIYDDASIGVMVKNGLLDVLVRKLSRMAVDAPKIEDNSEEATTKKRANDSPCQKAETKFNKTSTGRYSMDFPREDWSPGSATSVCSSAPSTPPLSLYNAEDVDDENAEDNYSPVCSDSEWENNDEEMMEEVESLKSCKSASVLDDDESRDSSQRVAAKPSNSEQSTLWTLSLLSRLSHSTEPIHKLADPATIKSLSAYINATRNLRASRILTRIVRNQAYLVQLVKQGFIFEAQTLYGSDNYTRPLCGLAETGGALGEFSSTLLRGSERDKCIVAVSIPFLIKSKDTLRTLLMFHNGLSVIFEILSQPSHELHRNAVWCICRLSASLQIRPDIVDKSTTTTSMELSTSSSGILDNESYKHIPMQSTVTFELDDGSTVEASRLLLCEKSDAFLAMLEGNFSESGKRRVKLSNASRQGLDTLLLAASGGNFGDRSIESLLDAVLLADKFLMPEVSDQLTETSISKLSHENFSRAWSWARSNACHELKTSCVKTFLSAKMHNDERTAAFADFTQSEFFSELLEDIREIVVGVLCQK